MSELKPCPFCGATDGRLEQAFTRATEDFAYWSVECLDCACEIASDASQDEADEAWNRRAEAEPHRFGSPPEPVANPNEAWCERYADWYYQGKA